MLKKVCLSLLAVLLILSGTGAYFGGSHEVEAAKKCKNPYKGYLKKYNPCVTHTSVNMFM